jgi:uncharacterized HAD superfamily protein
MLQERFLYKEQENNFLKNYNINPLLFKLFTKEKNIPFYPRAISMDLDGVVIDSAVPAVEEVNKLLGTNYVPDNINSYSWVRETLMKHKNTLKSLGVNRNQLKTFSEEFERHVWEDPEIIGRSPLLPGAEELVNAIYALQQKPIFITVRIPSLKDVTWQTLSQNFSQISKNDLYIRDNLDMDGIEFKTGIVKLHNIRMHLEDHLPTVKRIIEETSADVTIIPAGYNHLSRKDHSPRVYRYENYNRTAWPMVSDIRTLRAAGYCCVAQSH